MMTGSPEPILIFLVFRGYSCTNVVSADRPSAACIKMTESSLDSPPTPATMIAGVTQPTIIATTCCSASGKDWPSDGFPSKSNSRGDVLPFAPESMLCTLSFLSFFCSCLCMDWHELAASFFFVFLVFSGDCLSMSLFMFLSLL